MKRTLLLIVFLTWGGLLGACQANEPQKEESPTPAEEVVQDARPKDEPVCELERQRFVLRDGQWFAQCLETAVPRNSALWTSDGERVAVSVNEGCEAQGEQGLYLIEKGEVRYLAWGLEQPLGRGASISFVDDGIVATQGESCDKNLGLMIYHKELTAGEVMGEKHFLNLSHFWFVTVNDGERLVSLFDMSKVIGSLKEGVTNSFGQSCTVLWPVPEGRPDCRIESSVSLYDTSGWRHSEPTEGQYFPYGRPMTWAREKLGDYIVFVGGENAPDHTGKELVLFPKAWAMHRNLLPRRIPTPPVMGDGVQLVYDEAHGQLVLLDPASTHSWFLEDYRRWLPLEHKALEPLREKLGEVEQAPRPAKIEALRTPPSRAEFDLQQPPVWRNTDHLAPWFATYDKSEQAIVLYPYLAEATFCHPVQGMPGEKVCLASHP